MHPLDFSAWHDAGTTWGQAPITSRRVVDDGTFQMVHKVSVLLWQSVKRKAAHVLPQH